MIKTAIYFHKATTEQARILFNNHISNYDKFPLFGPDKLRNENLKQIVPDSYLNKSIFWTMEWNKEILFWLKPPFHSLEQGVKLNLNVHQRKFAEPGSGHYRVRGVAGSGKTQVLAFRAGKLASLGYRVLILSFNITLWHYIRDMVQRSPFSFSWDKFCLGHFHGFCKDILNQFGEKWPTENGDNETLFRELFRKKFSKKLETETMNDMMQFLLMRARIIM